MTPQHPYTTLRQRVDATRPLTTAPPAHGDGSPQQIPSRIGPYEILQPLGEGGMGRVFLARSPGSRLVALKVIRPEYAEAPHFRARFQREAQAARRVSGFFTPPVLDSDADAAQPWLATAYVPAPSLHDVVRDFGVLPEPALRSLGTGLAEALLAVHAAGIVHRDLKPGNVLVAEDGPRVIDFGISRAVDATQVTRTGAVMGTPGFMAPEQIESSREAGPAADVFSLGCVLVHAATGRSPFGTGGSVEILYRSVHHPPRLDGLPASLVPLIAACLDKDPARRPSAASLPAALGAAGSTTGGAAGPDTPRAADPNALLTEGLRQDLALRAAHAAALVTAPPVPVTPVTPLAPPAGTAGAARPSRRAFLGIAAAGTGLAAAGGAAALAAWPSWSGRAPARPDAQAGGATGRDEPGVPAGPQPRWSTPLKFPDGGSLDLIGHTPVHWNADDATAYDAETGEERWKGSVRLPPGMDAEPKWIGVHGSLLFATAWNGERGHLFGVDAAGRQKFGHAVTRPDSGSMRAASLQSVLSVTGPVAVLSTLSSTAYGVLAVELASGKALWSRTVRGSDFQAHTDGRRCYLQDNGTLLALDLRSGTAQWTVRDVVTPGTYPRLATRGSTLLVVSVKVQAFDTRDGRRLWTAIRETTTLSPPTVRGERVHLYNGQHVVHALDPRSGEPVWHTSSPLPLAVTGAAASQGPTLTPSAVVIATNRDGYGDQPAFVVLRASDGELLWAHRPSRDTSTGSGAWQVRGSGNALFAASDTTLHAFRSDTS